MPAVLPTSSKSLVLEQFIIGTRTFTYHLYTAIEPALSTSTTLGHLTEVSGDATYAPQDVAYTVWNHTTSGTLARATTGEANKVVFHLTDAADILGYYVTWNDGTDDHLILVVQYEAAIPQANDSDHGINASLDFGALSYS